MKNFELNSTFNTVDISWKSAKDFHVRGNDGREYVDMSAGNFAANSGHANQRIKEAIIQCLDNDLLYSYNYPTQPRKEFDHFFLNLVGERFQRLVHFNSGTEATTSAFLTMKALGKERGRTDIVFFKGNYHGRGVLGEWLREGGLLEKPDSIKLLEFPYHENEEFDPRSFPEPSKVAGIFLETYQGWGAWMYPKEYLRSLMNFCQEHQILVCFDEIQAGFWRMGELFGFDTYAPDMRPDMVCLSKGLSSSLPHALLLTNHKVPVDLNLNLHGTFSTSPPVLSASLANLKELKRITTQKDFHDKIRAFEDGCLGLAKGTGVKDINVKGMVGALIMDSKESADKVVFACLEKNLLLVRTNRESIKITPPLTMPVKKIEESFHIIKNELGL